MWVTRKSWFWGCNAVLATAVVFPMVAQQPRKSSEVTPRNLVRELPILDTGFRTGGIANAPTFNENYYFNSPEADWIPDEFMSNPDTNIDPRKLVGYHLPPRIKELKLIGARTYKAGDTIKFECTVFNKYKVNAFQLNYHGPDGRRTESYAEFRGAPKETWKEGDMVYQKFEGTLRLSKWAEPGTYLALAIQNLNNELGHGKSYRSDYLPEMDRTALAFDVEPNPNVDVIPPVLKKLVLGSLDGTTPKQPLQQKITDLIPVYAEIEDDVSGLDEAVVTLASPTRRYSDITLQPMIGKPGAYVGYFRLNRWYEPGEYWVSRVIMADAAKNERTSFPQSTAFLKEARIQIANDNSDMTPPKLITLNLDKESAKAGENVTVSAIVADDKAGVGEVVVTIHSPSSIDKRRVTLRPKSKPAIMIKPAYDVQENILQATFTIHVDDEPGTWVVERVVARDLANNYLDMVGREYPEIQTLEVRFLDATGRPATAVTGDTGYTADSGRAPALVPAPAQPGKIRRVDMTPPHPPRGACLNCHEP